MKKKISKHLAAAILILISFDSFSQQNGHHVPAWVNDNGYWIVEENLQSPLQHTIRFYNDVSSLIGKINIEGKFNLKKRKTKMQLKSMLQSSLITAAKEKVTTQKPDVAANQ